MTSGRGLSTISALLGALCLAGCGNTSRQPSIASSGAAGASASESGSGGSGTQASGGKPSTGGAAAGQGGSVAEAGQPAAGTGAGGEVSSGGAPTVLLHDCPAEPEPACPEKIHEGNVLAFAAGELKPFEGVTRIEGSLTINAPNDIDGLSCLTEVTEGITVSMGIVFDDVSLWGLRNVTTVGEGVDIRSSFGRVFVDCGFSRLEVLGKKYINGGAVDIFEGTTGKLDLARLKQVNHIRVHDSWLSDVQLPSNVQLEFGQLWFENNALLKSVLGFDNVQIDLGLNPVQGTYSALIKDNPQLPDCLARKLAQVLLDAGNDPSWVLVEGNLACFDE